MSVKWSEAAKAQLPEELWTPEQTSNYLHVPVPTLHTWRARSKGPKAYRVGRHLRYDPADVAAWLAQQGGDAA